VETRFNRVHLRNGNFIDGHLIEQANQSITLKVGTGEMTIRKDSILRDDKGRYRIELIRMRSFKEAPKLASIPLPSAVPGARPETRTTPSPATPEDPDVKVELTGNVADQIEQARAILRDKSLAHKIKAIQALGAVNGPEVAAFLVSVFGTLEDGTLDATVGTLVSGKDASVVAELKKFLSSDRSGLRSAATRVIGALGTKEDAASLIPLLRDADGKVRAVAIDGLRGLGAAEAFDDIAENLLHADPAVRSRAMDALLQLSRQNNLTERFTSILMQNLRAATGPARTELVVAIGRLGTAEAGTVMAGLVRDSDTTLRAHAIQALSRFSAAEYGQLIFDQMLVEREYWPRVQLAQTAQAMKLNKAVDPLIGWLNDQDENIRVASSRALIGITGQNFALSHQDWQDWRDKTRPAEEK
jgi:HEAT repeat protein